MADTDLLNYLNGFLTEERKAKFMDILSRRTRHFTVATEDLFQMHNASAVIRSCDVFGIQDAHLIEGKFGKRLDSKIAMGAQKWVDIQRYSSSVECMEALKDGGYKIIATTPHMNSCYLDEYDVTQKSAFFFGTERNGLSDEIIKNADGFLKIPMAGFTESLNISVSAAIILEHLTTKLRKSDVKWNLTPDEILEKQIDWAKKSIRSIDDILRRYAENN